MKIFMRVTIQDSHEGEGFMSLSDECACIAFGIDISNIDIFKTYFFLHGVFFYKQSSKQGNTEY